MDRVYFWLMLLISFTDIKLTFAVLSHQDIKNIKKNKPIPNSIKCSLKAYGGTLPYTVTAPTYFVQEQQQMIKEIEDTVKPFKIAVEKCWEAIMQTPNFKEISNNEDFKETLNHIKCTRDYVECPEDIKKSLMFLTNSFPRQPSFFHKENFRSCEVIEEKDGSIKIIIDANFFRQSKNDLAWFVIFEHENGHVRLGHHRDPSFLNKLIFTQDFFSRFDTKVEAALNIVLTELYHCREKQADIFALQQPNIKLNHVIAYKRFFEKQNMQSSLTHPSSADRVQYIDRLIKAYTKDIECNNAPLD